MAIIRVRHAKVRGVGHREVSIGEEGAMVISVINHSNSEIPDEELYSAIRAINQQIAHDFEPYW